METMSTSRKKAGKSSKLFGQPEPEAANMQKMIWRFLAIIAVLVWTVAAGHPAAPDFYAGKTLHIIVGSAAGGGFDIYSRVIARHIGKHLPGHPSVIVQNMPGAGQLIAANHLYRVAKPDGFTVGNISGACSASTLGTAGHRV